MTMIRTRFVQKLYMNVAFEDSKAGVVWKKYSLHLGSFKPQHVSPGVSWTEQFKFNLLTWTVTCVDAPNGRLPNSIGFDPTPSIRPKPEELLEDEFDDLAEEFPVSTRETENSSDKSNGTILSAATLDVITTAPRRVGPLFPDTLTASTKCTDIVIPGLEYLTSVDQLNIKNRPLCALLRCSRVPVRAFAVKNLLGQRLFQAKQNGACGSFCCRPSDPDLTLILEDNQRRQVLKMAKPLRCICHCFPCCLQVITVTSPEYGVLGSVHHEWSIANPRLSIKNPQEKTQFFIDGPPCTCVECQRDDTINFPVMSQNTGEQVGRISRHLTAHPQLSEKTLNPEEDYIVSFGKDLPVAMKAVFLAAVFLLVS
ncbi:phospholipid scramblase 2-like [Galendromus occidentalis]|uniref:Phospholipid scramblase n=1 Tax=Galendromus occidentalis TaxID=34638 RepID=A0AAJ7SGT6_9ACAR|nr:phospholipid scramblase 2-like [Galendromus occidentalis]